MFDNSLSFGTSQIVYLDSCVVPECVWINMNAEQRAFAILQLLHELDEARILLLFLP